MLARPPTNESINACKDSFLRLTDGLMIVDDDDDEASTSSVVCEDGRGMTFAKSLLAACMCESVSTREEEDDVAPTRVFFVPFNCSANNLICSSLKSLSPRRGGH